MVARSLMISLLALCAGPMLAHSAAAQEAKSSAKPSVEGYLCTFAGKCDGVESQSVSRDAPQTKGFRLARPVADNSSKGAQRVSNTPAAAAMVRSKPRWSSSYGTGNRRAVASSPVTTGVGTARPRADLMIGFDLNSAQLTAEGVAATQIFAKSLLMPELQSKRFLIEGHTDQRGGRSLNMSLSQRRAKAVADYLIILGVKPERLQARGFGADVPLPGHSATDPTNRRVEAELVS